MQKILPNFVGQFRKFRGSLRPYVCE